MSLNRMFDLIEDAKATANWKAAFGEPRQVEEKTIIPVAQVSYGFGLGFGQGARPDQADAPTESESGTGGGGGGGAMSKPLGVIVVKPDSVRFEPVADGTKIPLAGMVVGALFLWQVGVTLRALFGRR